jgi:hypothetical protein
MHQHNSAGYLSLGSMSYPRQKLRPDYLFLLDTFGFRHPLVEEPVDTHWTVTVVGAD